MPARRRKPSKDDGKKAKPSLGFELPIERRKPVPNIWQYAFLITGQKKIGKTALSIEGCEEFVIQFDKPQLAYEIRETCPTSWGEFEKVLRALERAAASDDFPYERVVIDGVGEWYAMCQVAVCKHFGVDHPQEVGYAKGWHKLRDDFNDAVNRLLRLQITAKCGLIFIAHAEWREVNTREAGKIERLVPNLPGRCEEIVNGKVDGWFTYDYVGTNRVMIVLGDETTGAGHRIDGRFMTTDGRRVREIYMGESAPEALEAFTAAFNNEQDYATYKEYRTKNKAASSDGGAAATGRGRRSRRKKAS